MRRRWPQLIFPDCSPPSRRTPSYPLVYRRGETLLIALNPGSQHHEVGLEHTGDAEPVLSHHCRVSHEERGWVLHIGARGYGIFGIR